MLQRTILRLPEVQKQSGYARSTIYLRIAQGLWTKPIKLGVRSIGWPASEVATLNNARIASFSDTEIQKLVHELEDARGQARKEGVK